MADDPGVFAHDTIDELVHGRIRLGVIAYLASVESALFSELRHKVGATDGNLSAHLRKLEDAGYVRAEKRFVRRKPQTRLSLTTNGRKAWEAWLDRMESIRRAVTGQD